MLGFWLNRDLLKGLHAYNVYTGIEIVEVSYEEESGERLIEPGPSLSDVEAMMHYVREQFPDGWRITEDGEIQRRDG